MNSAILLQWVNHFRRRAKEMALLAVASGIVLRSPAVKAMENAQADIKGENLPAIPNARLLDVTALNQVLLALPRAPEPNGLSNLDLATAAMLVGHFHHQTRRHSPYQTTPIVVYHDADRHLLHLVQAPTEDSDEREWRTAISVDPAQLAISRDHIAPHLQALLHGVADDEFGIEHHDDTRLTERLGIMFDQAAAYGVDERPERPTIDAGNDHLLEAHAYNFAAHALLTAPHETSRSLAKASALGDLRTYGLAHYYVRTYLPSIDFIRTIPDLALTLGPALTYQLVRDVFNRLLEEKELWAKAVAETLKQLPRLLKLFWPESKQANLQPTVRFITDYYYYMRPRLAFADTRHVDSVIGTIQAGLRKTYGQSYTGVQATVEPQEEP